MAIQVAIEANAGNKRNEPIKRSGFLVVRTKKVRDVQLSKSARRETCSVCLRSFSGIYLFLRKRKIFLCVCFESFGDVMRIVLLLTAAVLGVNCLPVPGGQIVKYRIPTKYFGKQNATGQGDDSLYNYLSLIHFGGAGQTSVPVSINAIQVDDVSHDGLQKKEPEREAEAMTTDSTTNESPGVSALQRASFGDFLIMSVSLIRRTTT